MTGMIVAPLWQLLVIWLGTVSVVASSAGCIGYLHGYDRGEADAQADQDRRPVPAPAPLRAVTEPIPAVLGEPISMWVLEAAIGIVEHEQRAAGNPLAGLDRAAEQTELEIRRLGSEAVRRIGAIAPR